MVRWLSGGNALIGAGILALWCAAAIVGYTLYAEWRQTVDALPGPRESLPSRVQSGISRLVGPPSATGTATPEVARRLPTATAGTARVQLLEPDIDDVSVVHTEASELPPFGSPDWLTIPKLDLEVSVTPVGVQDGEYLVPPWEVGHHEDSPNPGEPGNAILNGHLETLSSGHVFAQLDRLRTGDAVYTYTSSQRLTWRVARVVTVKNTDRSFLGSRADRWLTLYTCAGTFNPVAQDYSHRLVVMARLVESSDRES
jgi:LPXTG-site transpeptidase (sortase) family protein